MSQITAFMLTVLLIAGFAPRVPEPGDWPGIVRESAGATEDDDKPDYAPILDQKMDFFDFTYKTTDDLSLNLRNYTAGKQVVIVEYLAGWCRNSNRNGHVVERLWTKYRDRGLGVVGVAEYSDKDELRIHINRIGIDYPVVIETKNRWDRTDSSHFKYRRAVGDKRKWGTPFYVIIEARNIEPPPGKTLARRVFTVSGELVETEAEQFLEQRLPPRAGKEGASFGQGMRVESGIREAAGGLAEDSISRDR